jgi:hypothetical protein
MRVAQRVRYASERRSFHKLVMPGLVPGIHVFVPREKDVDGRDKPGHDEAEIRAARPYAIALP